MFGCRVVIRFLFAGAAAAAAAVDAAAAAGRACRSTASFGSRLDFNFKAQAADAGAAVSPAGCVTLDFNFTAGLPRL